MKILIIGTGVIALTHAKAIEDSKVLSLAGFVGRDEEKTKEIAKGFSVNGYIDIEEAISMEEIDIVDICLPTYLHEYAVSIAIKYKKHIMCEKPFTLSYEVADRLTCEARDADIKMMVLQVVRFWPEYVSIKDMIDKKTLGRVKHIYINRLSHYPIYSNWHTDPSKSGGGLYDLGIHDLDYLYYVFGEVKSLYAIGHKSSTGCYDSVTTNLIFNKNTTATVECNIDVKGEYPFTTYVRVTGEKGTLEYNSTSRYNDNLENIKYNELILYKEDEKPHKVQVDKYNPYQIQMEYFIDCVTNDKETSKMKMSEVLYVLKIISAIEKSLETNSVVTDI